jgi:4-amino-4-deoxy-L-arabinose transferase-like glycosyltransferase
MTFLVQFIFRNADDNRLTSWRWTFANVDLAWFASVIISGIIVVYVLLRIPKIDQNHGLFLLIFSAVVSAIFWKSPEVIVDASRYFTQAKHIEIYGIQNFIREWGNDINVWTDMPLIPFFYGLIFKFLGESRIYIQIFNTLLFSITTVLTYIIGKTLWDEKTGFYGGMLLLGIPYIFSQVPLMLVDIPAMFFLTLSIATFIKAVEKGKLWMVFSAVAIFCSFFTKYSAWLMLSVLGIVFFVYLKEREGARGKRQVGSRVFFVTLFTGLLISIVLFLKFGTISDQIKFLNEYQRPGLRRWGESFISTFFYQIHPFITSAALCSVYAALMKKDLKFLIISWLILIIVFMQIRRARYIMVAFPMFALMASYGLQKLKNTELRKYIVSSIVGSSIVIAVFAYLPFLQSMSLVNLKDAGRFLNSIDAEKIEVFTIPSEETVVNLAVSVPLLDMFAGKKMYYHHDGNFTLPFKRIMNSPLRFTGAYKNPEYYATTPEAFDGNPAVVVISNGVAAVLPENLMERLKDYERVKVFGISTGIFRFSPVVTVYAPKRL